MAIHKVLLPLTSVSSARSVVATGLQIARCHGAHLLALHVRTDVRDVAPLAGEGLSGAMIEEMMTATEQTVRSEANALKVLFEAMCADADVKITLPDFRGLHAPSTNKLAASAQFESIIGREEEVVAGEARVSDLIIVPHPKSAEEVASTDALHAVLFDSGRPALIAPVEEPTNLGTRIAVAWNGTAESSAAVASSLPWLIDARSVRILHSVEYHRQGPSAQKLASYLALHSVAAEVVEFSSVDRSVGAGLLAAATEYGADLLVMGAYSHSRLRQLILGGVTRHVLEHAQLPVLMNR